MWGVMSDTQTALDLRDVDLPEVLEEVGQPLTLIKQSYSKPLNPTQNAKITTEYQTYGVIFNQTDFYGNPLSANGNQQIVLDVSKLDGVFPEIADSISDGEVEYKIEEVITYRYAGMKIAAELKVSL